MCGFNSHNSEVIDMSGYGRIDNSVHKDFSFPAAGKAPSSPKDASPPDPVQIKINQVFSTLNEGTQNNVNAASIAANHVVSASTSGKVVDQVQSTFMETVGVGIGESSRSDSNLYATPLAPHFAGDDRSQVSSDASPGASNSPLSITGEPSKGKTTTAQTWLKRFSTALRLRKTSAKGSASGRKVGGLNTAKLTIKRTERLHILGKEIEVKKIASGKAKVVSVLVTTGADKEIIEHLDKKVVITPKKGLLEFLTKRKKTEICNEIIKQNHFSELYTKFFGKKAENIGMGMEVVQSPKGSFVATATRASGDIERIMQKPMPTHQRLLIALGCTKAGAQIGIFNAALQDWKPENFLLKGEDKLAGLDIKAAKEILGKDHPFIQNLIFDILKPKGSNGDEGYQVLMSDLGKFEFIPVDKSKFLTHLFNKTLDSMNVASIAKLLAAYNDGGKQALEAQIESSKSDPEKLEFLKNLQESIQIVADYERQKQEATDTMDTDMLITLALKQKQMELLEKRKSKVEFSKDAFQANESVHLFSSNIRFAPAGIKRASRKTETYGMAMAVQRIFEEELFQSELFKKNDGTPPGRLFSNEELQKKGNLDSLLPVGKRRGIEHFKLAHKAFAAGETEMDIIDPITKTTNTKTKPLKEKIPIELDRRGDMKNATREMMKAQDKAMKEYMNKFKEKVKDCMPNTPLAKNIEEYCELQLSQFGLVDSDKRLEPWEYHDKLAALSLKILDTTPGNAEIPNSQTLAG